MSSAPSAVAPSLVAGYIAAPDRGLATAEFHFKVPKLKCDGVGERAVSVGLGDVQDLESPRVRAHVTLTCPAEGRAEYTFAVQACSHAAGPLLTDHGHQVIVALAQSGGTITMTVTDQSAGATLSATDSTANCDPAGTVDSVLFGAFPVFSPGLIDVPEFKKVKSRDTTLNGADLTGVRVHRQTAPGIRAGKLRSTLSDNLPDGSRKSGDLFALRYRDVVHCCLAPAPLAGAPRRAV